MTFAAPLALLALPLVLAGLVAMTALSALRHAIAAMNMRPSSVLRE